MAKSNWKNSLTKVTNSLMQFDRYGETLSFTIQEKSSYPGCFSMLVSLFIFGAVLYYGHAKYEKMINLDDTDFQSFTEPFNWKKALHQN